MAHLKIVALLATLVALAAGCAEQGTGAFANRPQLSDASHSPIGSDLSGTWRGYFVQTGSDGHVDADLTLVIKDDGTYKMRSVRRGRGDVGASSDSGIVVPKGRMVTLQSSSGQSTQLVHKGDSLYGVAKAPSGHTIQINMERTSAVESP